MDFSRFKDRRDRTEAVNERVLASDEESGAPRI